MGAQTGLWLRSPIRGKCDTGCSDTCQAWPFSPFHHNNNTTWWWLFSVYLIRTCFSWIGHMKRMNNKCRKTGFCTLSCCWPDTGVVLETTWALVTISPLSDITKPDPLDRGMFRPKRGCLWCMEKHHTTLKLLLVGGQMSGQSGRISDHPSVQMTWLCRVSDKWA